MHEWVLLGLSTELAADTAASGSVAQAPFAAAAVAFVAEAHTWAAAENREAAGAGSPAPLAVRDTPISPTVSESQRVSHRFTTLLEPTAS